MRLAVMLVLAVCAFGAYNYYTGNSDSDRSARLRAAAADRTPSQVLASFGRPDERIVRGSKELWIYQETLRSVQLLVDNSRAVRVCVTSRITQKLGFGATSCRREVTGEAGL